MRRDPNTDAPNFFGFARDYLHAYMPTVRGLSPKTVEAYRISRVSPVTLSGHVWGVGVRQVGHDGWGLRGAGARRQGGHDGMGTARPAQVSCLTGRAADALGGAGHGRRTSR